jgi:thiol-disulfide isomerase/thioredoxin
MMPARALLTVLAATLLLAGCQPQRQPTEAGAAEATPNASVAPPLSLRDVDGHLVTLAGFANRPIVINLWASWLVPSQVELPLLQRTYARWGKEQLVVLAINEQESLNDVKSFVKESNLTFPVLLDPDQHAFDLLPAQALPTTLFLDRKHRIRYLHTGMLDQITLDREVANIVKR